MKYRADISGLRALAVVPVVLYHLELPFVPGGYVGVDIFFVISGYLITSILAADLREKRFSLLRFYDRRIRRIVPAYFTVALVTALVALVLLPPGLLTDFGRALRAASIFFANRYFLSTTFYFGAPPDEQWLLHTWSLSVEEQFYLVWPLLLVVLFHPRLRRFMPYILLALFAASLFVATRNAFFRPLAGFYNTNGRFWELLLGGFLALGLLPRLPNRAIAEAAAALGLAMIVGALALFGHDNVVFPGVSALLPTVGALLILWAGEEGRTTLVGRILSFAPFAAIGLISYSLYLWHWPVIAVHRYLTFRVPSPWECVMLLTAMVAISAFSWRFIEAPFRRHGATTARDEWKSVGIGVVALGSLVALSYVITLTGGLPVRASADFLKTEATVNDFWKGRMACLARRTAHADVECRFGDPDPKAPLVLLWGDSYGDQHGPALDALGRAHHFAFLQMTWPGCAPQAPTENLDALAPAILQSCNASRAEALERVVREQSVSLVIIAGNWLNEPSIPFAMDRLKTAVDRITASGKPVLLVAPVGSFGTAGGRCVVRKRFVGLDDSVCNEPRALWNARFGALEQGLLGLAEGRQDVSVFLPRDAFCRGDVCSPVGSDGTPLFYDGGHLNVLGSLFLAKAWEPFLKSLADQGSR